MRSKYGVDLDTIREDSIYLVDGEWALWSILYSDGSKSFALTGNSDEYPWKYMDEYAVYKKKDVFKGLYVDACFWKNEKLGYEKYNISPTELKKDE